MEKDTNIPLDAKMATKIHKLSERLRLKAKKLDILNDECEAFHNRIWDVIGKHPDVATENSVYTYNHVDDVLTYRGPKPEEPGEMIKDVLSKIFEHVDEPESKTEH